MSPPPDIPAANSDARPLLALLVALSVAGLAVRLYAARIVGFGDSEALYADYALYPAPAYLDHPGLIGLLARSLGGGAAPSPWAAHVFTAIASSLAPWMSVGASHLLGARLRAAIVAGLATVAAPEVAIGLFGMTPDLLLLFAWLGALALFGRALQEEPGSLASAALFAASGVLLGVTCASKVSGLTLAAAFVMTLTSPGARSHARTLWPWACLALAAMIFAPVVVYEARAGFPMVQHRLVATQHDAGISLRNVLGIVVGQAAYVSPVLAVAGAMVARLIFRARRDDLTTTLLWSATFVPLTVLGALCLWSPVAEPHWLAPAWLSLPVAYALRVGRAPSPVSRPLAIASVASGLALSSAVYAWVLVPSLVALVPTSLYQPRFDLANELYGWPKVTSTLDDLIARTRDERQLGPSDVVVVGSVWTVCAQLRAQLPADVPVACVGDNIADFASWAPKERWSNAEAVLFVHDNRAPADSARFFPDRFPYRVSSLTVTRGGRTAREFTFELLIPRAAALWGPSVTAPRPG